MDFLSTLTYYDYIVVAILLASVLFGIYKGFLSSAGSCVIMACALLLSLTLTDNLAYTVQQKTNALEEINYYVQADEKIADLTLRKKSIYSMTDEEVEEIVEQSGLSEIFKQNIVRNVENRTFTAVETIGEYFDYTVGSVTLNILCFCGIFIFSAIVLSVLKSAIESMIKLPALKMFDGILGASFGILRGILFVYIFLMIVPVIVAVLPSSIINELVGDITETPIASVFYNSNLLMDFIGGFIKVA